MSYTRQFAPVICTLAAITRLIRFGSLLIILLLRISGSTANEKPTIAEHPLDVLVVRGDPVTLRCGTTGENVVVSWFKDGEPVKVGSAHRLVLPNGSLLLLKVNSGGVDSEAGTYYCMARNEYGEVRSQEANLRVASLRDEFRTNPHAVQALMGSQAVLECSPPKGFPEPMVTWRRDDKDVNFAEETRYKLHPSGNFIIENVERADAGFYQCIATNMVGERVSKPARLSVYEKPRFLAEPKDLTAEANTSILFECRVSGEPLPSISWKKRGEQMPVGRAYVTKDSHGLRIDSVQPDDAGEYICVAKNPVGSMETSARLQVNAPPHFTKSPENVRVAVGETAAFACEAAGRPQPGIFWSKEGDQDFTFFTGLVSTDGRIQVASDGRLLIDGVRASDAGNYVCAAVNAAGSTLAKASLSVITRASPSHPPPVIMYGHQNQTLMVSDTAILPCQASGRLPSTISWSKDGTPLALTKIEDGARDALNVRFRQLVTGTLQILDLIKADTGVYTCRAKNEDGEATWTASLVVDEHTNPNTLFQRMPEAGAFPSAPGKPRLINATDDTIELEWTTPEKQGATPIIGYILQYWSPTLKESWINVFDVVTSSRFRVKRLRPSSSYAFVVRAENSKGIGPPSEISDIIATKPSSGGEKDRVNEALDLEVARKRLAAEQLVKLVEVRPLNATAILLTWRRQRYESLVQGYYIKWRGPPLVVTPIVGAAGASAPEHSWVNVSDAKAESAVVGGLRPANHYEFFVIPYHQSVQGMPSNSLDGTTAEDVPTMPPSDVRVRLLNVTSLRVSWRPPLAHAMNGVLKGYLINIKSNQSEERNITTNERATSVTLYRLIVDASYAIRVAARTSAGYGPFFIGEPVVMNEETLQNHIRQSEMRHGDAWYRHSLSILTGGVFLWCVLVMSIVLVWYRCCHRPARRKGAGGSGGNSTKDAREFIKIRDGSVVAIGGPGGGGTMARNAVFWSGNHTNSSMALSGQMTADGGNCFSNCIGHGSNGNGCAHQLQHHHHNYSHHVCNDSASGECVNCGIYGGGTDSDYCMSGSTLPAMVHGGNGNAPSYYGINGNGNRNPTTLQKVSMARSHSPSQHYHYAQLPDVAPGNGGSDSMSTFCNQSTNRLYYDDPSPYATTTLVMSDRSTHTPRAIHRGGTIGHMHNHHHHHHGSSGGTPGQPLQGQHHVTSHGNLAALINANNGGGGGPLLPLNPVPKEPPRNFLSNTAMDATKSAVPHKISCCDASASQLTACCYAPPPPPVALPPQAVTRASCGALLDISSCRSCDNNNCVINNNSNNIPQHQCCAIADNKSSQCCSSNKNLLQTSKCCSSQSNVRHAQFSDVSETTHERSYNEYPQNHCNSPYTDVSYIQSSDGTNGSAKTANLTPPANILDLVPPPPSEPPCDIQTVGVLYDAVSEQRQQPQSQQFANVTASHQRALSAELSAVAAASRSSLHSVNRGQRRGYSSGSMSRARSRSNKSNQPKSRLSLVEHDDCDTANGVNDGNGGGVEARFAAAAAAAIASASTVSAALATNSFTNSPEVNFRNGAARHHVAADGKCERDPLLAADGGADDAEADDETSEEEDKTRNNKNKFNNNNDVDDYFNNNNRTSNFKSFAFNNHNNNNNWANKFSPKAQQQQKPKQPIMGVNASALSHDTSLNITNRMSTSKLHS